MLLLIYTQLNLLFCQTPLQLENPTQLQLVGEGVDFVFPWKKKEGRNNPHLASSRRNAPTRLNFGDLSCGHLEGVWKLSGGCLAGVCWLSEGCLKGL